MCEYRRGRFHPLPRSSSYMMEIKATRPHLPCSVTRNKRLAFRPCCLLPVVKAVWECLQQPCKVDRSSHFPREGKQRVCPKSGKPSPGESEIRTRDQQARGAVEEKAGSLREPSPALRRTETLARRPRWLGRRQAPFPNSQQSGRELEVPAAQGQQALQGNLRPGQGSGCWAGLASDPSSPARLGRLLPAPPALLCMKASQPGQAWSCQRPACSLLPPGRPGHSAPLARRSL